jgi:phosphoglucosamine mutase
LPQKLVNVRHRPGTRPLQEAAVADYLAEADREVAGRGRLLVRASGTEPLIRIMVEGENEAEVAAMAQSLADGVRQRLGAVT